MDEVILSVSVNEFVKFRVNVTNLVVALDNVNDCVSNLTLVRKDCILVASVIEFVS